jgi:geranylgeranyl pyrophosphate synthase
MIGGQLHDLEAEGGAKQLDRSGLDAIHRAKTDRSLPLPWRSAESPPARLRDRCVLSLITGRASDLLFRIMDDVLDLTSSTDRMGKITGRDVALGKSTYPALLGVDEAVARAESLVREACDGLRTLGLLTPELDDIAGFIVSRNH